MKYANGQEGSRRYFENILDINCFFDNNVYLFTQLEYSFPPLLGENTILTPDGINNIFYIQYTKDNYDFTIGDLYLLRGRGLSLHTYQDRTIDYDNSIKGVDFTYIINDKIDLFSSIGTSTVKSRINPADILPSVSIKNNLSSIGVSSTFNNMSLLYHSIVYEQFYDYSDVNSLMNLTNLLGQYLNGRSDYILSEKPSYSMTNVEHNLGIDFYMGPIELYFEKSLVFYDKIIGERTDGYRNYVSTYVNILNFDILFEFKDYYTPFLYNIFSTPPIAFRESASILSSRNLHSIDFSNEYGYQFEINKSFKNSLNMVVSYSFAINRQLELDTPNIFDFINSQDFLDLSDFSPYKQFYMEFSNWTNNNKFYYRIGYDYYYEITDLKTIIAKTIPMQYAFNFKKGNSVTLYLETQNKNDKIAGIKYDYYYISPSYNHFGEWIVTVFLDYEKDGKNWVGSDYTYNFTKSQLSVFVGSQKGGLICANGTCVMQPDFNKGVKATYRISL